MNNFIEEFKKGQSGNNFGLPMGLLQLENSLDGIQRSTIYTIASAPKCGKSCFIDYSFILQPFIYSIDHPEVDVEWIYYSFEIERVMKEYKFAAYFMAHDYGIYNFIYKDNLYLMSPRYLLGRLKDDNGNLIQMFPEHVDMLKEIYNKRIIPIFGEYNTDGSVIKQGKVKFIEQRINPTGIRNDLLHYAEQNGTFIKEKYKTKEDGKVVMKERIRSYKANNPKKITIVITDHIRLLNLERNFTPKMNIDKYSQYQVELRNWCGFTFVNVIHLNRSIGATDRISFHKEFLYPTGDDIKDSGNLSEDSNVVITLFNPRDEKYNLTKHFGTELEGYPNYRSIHIVESRDSVCPSHFKANMYGNINMFEMIN